MTFDEMVLIAMIVWCLTSPIVIAAHFAYRMLYKDDKEDDRL